MEKLVLDKDTKELLKDISSLFGVKEDIIKDVWEYTLITWLLKLSDSNANLKRIKIPYIGSVGLRFLGEKIGDEKIDADYDAFLALNENFKDVLKTIKNNGSEELTQLIQQKIKRLASQI